MIATLLLAAGQSSRMRGGDKLLEIVDGKPVLGLLAARALTLGPTFVTVPALNHPRRKVLPNAAQVVAVQGQMSDSIKAGIMALPDTTSGVMILPADMPDITAQDMAAIHAAARASDALIVRAATEDGRAGHPIYFAATLFHLFDTLSEDRGAFRLAKGYEDQTLLVPLRGDRARLDLDTPEDWAAYRNR